MQAFNIVSDATEVCWSGPGPHLETKLLESEPVCIGSVEVAYLLKGDGNRDVDDPE